MDKIIWFDMDGTIADLYSVNGWLNKLLTEDASCYEEARPMLNLRILARKLNKLQKSGFQLGIISWCSKNSTKAFDNKVINAKLRWLNMRLHSVKWDYINIVPYGTNKWETCGKTGVLFDDEEQNRTAWENGKAYTPNRIFNILNELEKAS